jgi:zinc-ribbon domain
MYCNQCGKELQPNQQFCSSCGTAALGASAVLARPDPMGRHVHLLGVLWLVLGILTALSGVAAVIVAHLIFGPGGVATENGAPPFIRPLVSMVGILFLIKAALCFLAGIGLLQRQSWGRVLAIVLGFVSLVHVPFGTALGIYTIWVLLSANAEERYARLAAGTA